MPAFPIHTPIESRDGSLTKGAFLKNAVTERLGEAWQTFRRPGLLVFGTSGTGLGQGVTNYFDPDDNEFLFSALGGSLYNSGARLPSTTWNIGSTGISIGSGTGDLWQVVSWRGYLWAVGGMIDDAVSRFAMAYSSDYGVTWVKTVDVADGTSGYPASKAWNLVVHNGDLYLIYGSVGTVSRSTWKTSNGVTFTQVNSGTTGPAASLCIGAVSFGGNLYAFFDNTTSNGIWKSTDNGATWALETANPSYNTGGTARDTFSVVNAGARVYVLGGNCGAASDAKVYYSTDMTTWTQAGSDALSAIVGGTNVSNHVHCVATSGLLLIIGWETLAGVASASMYYSTDGATWTSAGTLSDLATSGYPDWNGITVDEVWYWASNAGGGNYCVHKGRFCVNSKANTTMTHRRGFFNLPLNVSAPLVSIGSIGNGFVDFAQNYVRTILAVKDENVLYYLNTTTQALTRVTDSDYPAVTVRGLVYLDGRFYVMDPDGNICNSADEDITSWPATDYIAAEFEPDGGVCLIKYNNYIVAMGEYSSEFFYNAGNASNSPLSPVQNGVMNVGCADGDTVVTVDDQVFFVARSKGSSQSVTNARFVAKFTGTTYQKISTPDIDRILLNDNFTDVVATSFSVAGHSYYILRLGASAISLVFDLSQELWHVWTRRRTAFTQALSSVVTAGGTAVYTGTHSFSDGDVGIITGFAGTHTSLNGTYNFVVPSGTSLKWILSGTTYTATSTGAGTATGYTEDDFGINSATGYFGKQIMQDKSNGKLYELSPTTYQDDSVYMDWVARFMKYDEGDNKRKWAAWADFVADKVTGNVMLRMSDDDSQTWTRYAQRSLAGQRVRWNRLGNFRRRVFELRVTDNIAVRAQRLEFAPESDR